MKFDLLDGDMGRRTFELVFEIDDPVKDELLTFAKLQGLAGARFMAIGAFREAVLAYWSWEAKEYREIPVREQVEVLSLTGNLAYGPDGQPMVHAHTTLGKADGTTLGGHLVEGYVRPTLEMVVREAPKRLQRKRDRMTGLDLIEL